MNFFSRKSIPWRKLDDRVVIIHTFAGEVHELNETASLIWQSLDGVKSQDQIAQDLCAQFEVTPQNALQDTEETLRLFQKLQLIDLK